MIARIVLLLVLAMASSSGWPAAATAAVTPGEQLADPAQEARARAIGQELRCLVCQNQSIDESDAELAGDLRKLVRQRIVAGDSDRQILRFMTDRYGAFVLLRPPMTAATYALWFGPLALLVAAVATAIAWRRRAGGEAEPPWSALDQQLFDQAVAGRDGADGAKGGQTGAG